MNRTALVFGLFWAAVTAAVALVPGCYGRTCEASGETYGTEPGEGRMIDADTWESSQIDGKWLFYPGARVWGFEVLAWGDRRPVEIDAYVSASEAPHSPDTAFGQSAKAGGNLAELSGIGQNRLVIRNGTCAQYWLRVVVHLEPRPPQGAVPPPSMDAGVDAGADASDAATDAGDAEAGQ